jgi:hypothetical protein
MLKDLKYKAKPVSTWRGMFRWEYYLDRRKTLLEIGVRIAAAMPDFGRVMQVVEDASLPIESTSILALCPLDRIFRTPEQLTLLAAYRRNQERFRGGYWMKVGWEESDWFHSSAFRFIHSLHVPREPQHKGMVAFAESDAKFVADRFTVMKPGRYLQKYFGDKLDPKQIKELADEYVGAHMVGELKWAKEQEEMIRVINLGPSTSCMSAGFNNGEEQWFRGHIHPAAVYAAGDIHVAYMENGNGEVIARAVCNINNKTAARIYGDERLLLPALEAAGYTQEQCALVGCRLLKIRNQSGRGHDWIMPYVDAGIGSGGGYLYVNDDGKYWDLKENGDASTYAAYEGGGTFDGDDYRCECPCCGDRVDEDDLEYVECREESICRGCIEHSYVWGIIGDRRHSEGYMHVDDAIFCRSDNMYYAPDVTGDHGVYPCEIRDKYYHVDDLVMTSRGFIHNEEADSLDEPDDEGNSFAHPDDTIKTHDGRTIHQDNSVEHDGKIYHKDDDIEDTATEGEATEGVSEHA